MQPPGLAYPFMRRFLLSGVALLFFLFTRPALSNELTYEKLVKLIQKKRIHSIEQLLAQPELEKQRSRYTLMYRSQSQQPASFESPRAILFGEDAKLIISFNGDPKLWKPSDGQTDADNPFNKLEIIQYRDKSAKFDFYEIQFPPKDLSVLSGESKSNPASKVVFSKRNPARCMECHRGPEDPRPNWDHYARWPGAYGGDDDFLERDELEPGERAHLDAFIQSSKAHPRYAFLPSLKERYTFASDERRVAGHNNSALTEALGALNFRRIVRNIKSIPQYEDKKYIILAGINECFGQDNKVGKIVIKRKFPFSDFLPGISEPTMSYRWSYEDNLRLLFQQWGIPIDDWFMNFKKNAENRFSIPSRSDHVLMGLLVDSDTRDLFKLENDVRELPYPYAEPRMSTKDPSDICVHLRERHLAMLAKKKIQESKAPWLTRMKLFLKKRGEGTSPSGQEKMCEPSSSGLTGVPPQIQILEKPVHLLLKENPLRPEKLQSCVSCHAWMAPENLEGKLKTKSKSSERTLKEEILYRISSEARKAGKGMPMNESNALNTDEAKEVKAYLDSL